MSNVTSINPAHLQRAPYQRAVDIKRVDRIARSFNSAALGAVTVSQRTDGTLWVIDGSHRTAAAIQVGEPTIPAIVKTRLTEANEAALFLELNDAKSVSAVGKFNASVVAGLPVQTSINSLIASYGWKVSDQKGNGQVAAVSALEFIFNGAKERPAEDGFDILDTVVHVVTTAWRLDADGMNGQLLRGVGKVVARNYGQIDSQHLIRKFQEATPHILLGEARGAAKTLGITTPDGVARAVVMLYNTKRRKNVLPAWEV